VKPKIQFICLLLIIAVLFGCSPKSYFSSPYPATATFQINNSLPTPTLVQSTSTLPVSSTDSSPTVLPTLEASKAYLLLQEFLKNDPPCQLPCWGGITPGETKLADAQYQLTKLNSISDRVYFGEAGDALVVGTVHIPFFLKNTGVGIRAGYVVSRDSEMVILNGIRFDFFPNKNSNEIVYNYEEYNAFLSAYTLPQIFATYGLPNLIYTVADKNTAEENAGDFFIIRLLYLDLGIFISYTMGMEETEKEFQFCPSKSTIDMELTSSDVGDTYGDFFQQLGVMEWFYFKEPRYQLLEDALGMTNEEFSKVIISSPESCFESPIKIWPEP
jgi:hypothetical protein